MTHEYTLLVGGTVIAGGGAPVATAIAWADDTVLAIGTDEEVRAISRGDSHLVDLQGAWVVPLASVLEMGGRADLAVFPHDPGPWPAPDPETQLAEAQLTGALSVIRAGRVVAGALPGLDGHDHGEDSGRHLGS